MLAKVVHFALAAVLVISSIEGKKSKNVKLNEDATPQPSVVTYSTFGFNDVSPIDGFVPSSPDHINNFNGYAQDGPTRLYGPAFPSAPDTETPNDYGSQLGQTYNIDEENTGTQESMLQYQPYLMNLYESPSIDSKSAGFTKSSDQIYSDSSVVPMYGAKIGSKGKKYQINDTEKYINSEPFGSSGSYRGYDNVQNVDKYNFLQGDNHQSNMNSYSPNTGYSTFDDMTKPTGSSINSIKFPKVVDFTKMKENYSTELDTKYISEVKPTNLKTYHIDLSHTDANENENHKVKPNKPNKGAYDSKNEKDYSKTNAYYNQASTQNYVGHSGDSKNILKGNKLITNYREKNKSRPSATNNHSSYYKNWQVPSKGYEYSTNYSNTSFKLGVTENKRPFHSSIDEIVSDSSNVIDLTTSPYFNTDISSFKKIPELKSQYEDTFSKFTQDNSNEDNDYVKQLKKLYGTALTSSSQWGNTFQSPENDYSTYINNIKKPYYPGELNTDIVHIPKKTYRNPFKFSDDNPSDWGFVSKHKPYKISVNDWNSGVTSNTFKSEEDLLGLRNHDTSVPLHFPSHKPIKDELSHFDYKKIAEKWRQSYLQAKYKDYSNNYESYPTEDRPVHVPVPKTFPIEVPHPVIVPVPQPYPVHVPVPKPVAVPVVQEIKVPIEKPVPYPVIKKIPYPVVKPVPVSVEKQIPVPVIKPYAVPVPQVRPVFHHSNKYKEEFDNDDDYLPRPDSTEIRSSKKYPQYYKRPRNTRAKARRPMSSGSNYYDRKKRPYSGTEQRYHTRPRPARDPYYFRNQEYDVEDYSPEERSDYLHLRCRTGKVKC